HLFRQLEFPYFTRITCTVCGQLCSHANLYTEAMEYMAEAHTVALQMGDTRGALTCTANLNDIRLNVLSTDDCISYNLELLADTDNFFEGKPNTIVAGTCLQLAHLYLKLKDPATAAGYAARTADTLMHIDYLPPHFFLYTNLYGIKAEIACMLGKEADALKYADECSQRGRLGNKVVPEIDANFILFRFYMGRGQVRKAKRHLDHAESILPISDKSYIYLQLLENKCLYYNAAGNAKAELEQFKLLHEYKIKTHEEANKHRINYLALAHDIELKKRQIEDQKTQLSFRTQELNMASYHLEQRNRLLTDIEESLNTLKKARPKPEVIFKTISKTIKRAYNKEEEEKERFREKFDETQREFIAHLHRTYPQLSATECRVSALLRSGFNTKEIANLLSASTRTIENHRQHIRKKMNLNGGENLGLLLNAMQH
ncbi:MAG TPA: helix-turn-helix transcriptional regulator, partial [Chitinophagales bacterium]|nr:helix-turn-helix transcriptional regulator [Chitinophagales bacterium]